jgi:glyoxylase-like metal-dependent hydrolase (beta-lactamase superfamily II)
MSEYETLQQLTERIYYLPADHRTDRPILAAIVGKRRVLMVDAGASPRHAQLFLDALYQATGRRPDWVVLTHWHWDHTFGLSHLAIPSFGHVNLTRNLSRLQGLSWEDDALDGRVKRGEEIAFCAENIRKEYGQSRDIAIALPTITFDGALTLYLGGVICELHYLPTDHTDDALAIYIPEEETLFVGDALGQNLYATPPYYSAAGVTRLMATIDRFSARWFVESHGIPVDREAFLAENRILTVVAETIQSGTRQLESLVDAVKQRLGDQLPDDYEEVVDLFLVGEARP